MRDILFRGKRVDNKQWVEGSLVNNIFFRTESNHPIPYIIDPDEYEEYCCMEDIGELAVEVAPETVGQFTELTDKSGVKIFEGDIVKCHAIETTEVVIVEDIRNIPEHFKWVDIYKGSTIEIIGNIHDQKEDV